MAPSGYVLLSGRSSRGQAGGVPLDHARVDPAARQGRELLERPNQERLVRVAEHDLVAPAVREEHVLVEHHVGALRAARDDVARLHVPELVPDAVEDAPQLLLVAARASVVLVLGEVRHHQPVAARPDAGDDPVEDDGGGRASELLGGLLREPADHAVVADLGHRPEEVAAASPREGQRDGDLLEVLLGADHRAQGDVLLLVVDADDAGHAESEVAPLVGVHLVELLLLDEGLLDQLATMDAPEGVPRSSEFVGHQESSPVIASAKAARLDCSPSTPMKFSLASLTASCTDSMASLVWRTMCEPPRSST